ITFVNVNQPANLTFCNGDAATFSFTGNSSGSYSWTNNNTAIGLSASGAGSSNGFTATNSGTTPISGTITVTPSFSGCSGNSKTFTITVNPTPTVNAVAGQTVCNNSPTAAVTFSGAVSGTTFNWTNDNASIGLAASGTGNIGSFTAINTGASAVTATI